MFSSSLFFSNAKSCSLSASCSRRKRVKVCAEKQEGTGTALQKPALPKPIPLPLPNSPKSFSAGPSTLLKPNGTNPYTQNPQPQIGAPPALDNGRNQANTSVNTPGANGNPSSSGQGIATSGVTPISTLSRPAAPVAPLLPPPTSTSALPRPAAPNTNSPQSPLQRPSGLSPPSLGKAPSPMPISTLSKPATLPPPPSTLSQPLARPAPASAAGLPTLPRPPLAPPGLPPGTAPLQRPALAPAPSPSIASRPTLPPAPAPGLGNVLKPMLSPTLPPPPSSLSILQSPIRPSLPTLSKPGAQSNGAMTLRKPDAPPLRVLDTLYKPPTGPSTTSPGDTKAAGLGTGALRKPTIQIEEVIEDGEALASVDWDENADGKLKKKKGRKEKVTAEMKRKAREQRAAEREEKAKALVREREEIFEIGDEGMSLEELAEKIQIDPSEIVRTLFMKGVMLSMNQVLDKNTVKVVGAEYGLLVVDKEEASSTQKRKEYLEEEELEDAVPRPPVVVVMGHVDHGKTSLLDMIRKARVAAGEAGGITQAIGAYNTTVNVDGEERTICFLDTPGHEAFSAMRARGAQVTDIAIILVAADDGMQPQTREAISHAQAAEVPIIVAINKIDKPGADIERTKQQLLEMNLVAEEWGGNTPIIPISAKKGEGVDQLLTTVCWVAEERSLMANPNRRGVGTVIEAHLDKRVGPVATLLVQAGTLRVGDCVSAGATFGRVRSLTDDLGKTVETAGPSIAVSMVGLNSVPAAGEEFEAMPTEQDARNRAEEYAQKLRAVRMSEMTGGGSMVTLSSLATMDEDVEIMQRINIIIKADTMGMVEAIKNALSQLPQSSVSLRFLLSSAGEISISDIDLAAASSGLVLGFNLECTEVVQAHAKRQGVDIKTYKVIYSLIDDVKAAMEGKLRILEEKVQVGKAEVKALFGSGKRKVAGCAVTEGKLVKNAMVMVKRGKNTVYDGKINSLKRVKDDVNEVISGLECGLGCDGFMEWAVGDVLECYQVITKSQRLEDAKAATAVDMSTIGT